ncbi:MAG: hypothetical protein ABIG35_01245 [Pseudomonadota bacterium]
MRNPDRIAETIREIERAWLAHPELRLGQLLANSVPGDVFHVHDEVLVAAVRNFSSDNEQKTPTSSQETPVIEYDIGRVVWIAMGVPRLIQGTIVHKFKLAEREHPIEWQYVVEVPTHVDIVLELRSWQTISEAAEGPLNIFKDGGQ